VGEKGEAALASNTWRLVVTELGGTTALADVTVEAPNWMRALSSGRQAFGEEGGVPTGASCAVAHDGRVTIHDPVARRSYFLKPDAELAPTPAQPAQKQAPVSQWPLGPELPTSFEEGPPAPREKRISQWPLEPTHAPPVAPAAQARVAQWPLEPSSPPPPPPPPAPAAPAAASPGRVAVWPEQSEAPPPPPAPSPAAQAPTTAAAGSGHVAAWPTEAAPPPPPPGSAPSKPAPDPRRTMAYAASPFAPAPAAEVAGGAAPRAAHSQPATPPPAPPQPAAPPEVTAAQPGAPQPQPAAAASPAPPPPPSASAAPPTSGGWTLLSHRSEDPSPENPLYYRERTYAVPEATPEPVAEQLLRERLREVRLELERVERGKFVNLAVFDHAWQDRPQRPPIVTLQWKDWRGDPELAFPLRTSRPSGPRVPSHLPPRRRPTTDEHDARLARAFEACQDLLFLATPAEALDFVVRLLDELVTCEAVSACLYDINTNEFRFVALTGAGADVRQGEAIPADTGILGAASHVVGAAVAVPDVAADRRFDPGVDGRVGIEPHNMLYMSLSHQGRLLGMLQLINRQQKPQFSPADAEAVAYVGKQVSEFLYQARIAPESRPK